MTPISSASSVAQRPRRKGGFEPPMKRGFQTRDAELDLGRMLGELTAPGESSYTSRTFNKGGRQ